MDDKPINMGGQHSISSQKYIPTELVDDRGAGNRALIRKLNNKIKKLKTALSDAIRRPMGVFPASAEGLITENDVNDAEVRRVRDEK